MTANQQIRTAVLHQLTSVEAQRRLLARRSADLLRKASDVGVTQHELAAVLAVSQPTVSRLMPKSDRPGTEPLRQVEDAVDHHIAGLTQLDEFISELKAAGATRATVSPVDRATTQGWISPDTAAAVHEALEATRPDRWADLSDDELLDELHQATLAAVARLRSQNPTQPWADLVDAERRATLTDRPGIIRQLETCRHITQTGSR